MAKAWPYPRWIAHRGAGRLAPENTLAAFARGHAHGYRMFECDVRLSADEVPFLLHDDDLQRTTDGAGAAAARAWAQLASLDAGSWHGPAHAGESLPTLAAVIDFCARHECALNVELKPAPGAAARTGEVVASLLAAHWRAALPPLLSSFQSAALASARAAAPELPRALLLDHFGADWLQRAAALDCMALICEQRLWTAERVRAARAAGFCCAAFTVNDEATARRLSACGVDALITDAVDRFAPEHALLA